MPPRLPPRRLAALPVAVAVAVAAGCSKPEPPKPAAAPTVSGQTISFPRETEPAGVRVVTVASDAQRAITVPGRLMWDEDRTTRVYAPYAGRIDRLLVEVGQSVRRGQPLAIVKSAEIGQAQADLHKAQADLDLARSSAARAKELAEGGVIAGKELQQAQADLARATAEAERTRARLAQYGVASSAVNQSLTLVAPLAGVVVERSGNPGAEVRSDVQGTPLFTISDPTSLWAGLDVDESLLDAFERGQRLELRAAAWPQTTFEATVSSIGEAVDPTTRRVKVRARVPNPERKLKAEMFVSARVDRAAGAPLVPTDAVYLRANRYYAFVQREPNRYERRQVEVRAAGPQSWLVLRGIAPGDRVVVGGGLYLDQLVEAAQ